MVSRDLQCHGGIEAVQAQKFPVHTNCRAVHYGNREALPHRLTANRRVLAQQLVRPCRPQRPNAKRVAKRLNPG